LRICFGEALQKVLKLKEILMKFRSLLLLAAGLLIAAHGQAEETDFDLLQGTWVTVSLVNDGKTVVDEKAPQGGLATKLTYEGNGWLVQVGDKIVASGIFALDLTKKPKEIDVMDESGMTNEKTQLGIYELDGDTYKYCLAPAGQPRPTEFTSEPGSGHALIVSQREKPEEGN
jgi:uncharacterized protein (TIGR03067 family)